MLIIQRKLEDIKKQTSGMEFWYARELMELLGYARWDSFEPVIKKAIVSCEQQGLQCDDHFRQVTKMVSIGSGAQRLVSDILLTRYACYLIAQNGDPTKPAIAASQNYFAIQTRRQEVGQERDEEDKRLEERSKLKETERKIEGTVYQRGIKTSIEFATFKNKHIEALYSINTPILKKLRGIPDNRALADFDSDVELKAKSFALGMTDHNIKEKNLIGRSRLEAEVVENSKATREALRSRGIIPEKIEAKEDIRKIEQRRKKEQKLLDNELKKRLGT
jgi:DNA-damage-inducible protein D